MPDGVKDSKKVDAATGSAGRARSKIIDKAAERAQTGPRDEGRRYTPGLTGASRSTKWGNDMTKRTGEDGEDAYGAPTKRQAPRKRSEKERKAKPDPLKRKKK